MKISVIVPVYNQSHLTKQCLESLFKNSREKLQIFIIDNASSDDTQEILQNYQLKFEELGHKFEIISNKKNVGFGRAMNQGARAATGEFLALLNNDTWLMPSWDLALLEVIKKNQVSMIGPYYYEGKLDEKISIKASKFIKKNKGKSRKHWVSILMFFKRGDFEKVGMFDEDYFVSFEDNDLKMRMEKMNLSYLQTGSCFIWHHSKGTRDSKEEILKDHEKVGLEIFMKKWGFDPRPFETTFKSKIVRKWRKLKEKYGYF